MLTKGKLIKSSNLTILPPPDIVKEPQGGLGGLTTGNIPGGEDKVVERNSAGPQLATGLKYCYYLHGSQDTVHCTDSHSNEAYAQIQVLLNPRIFRFPPGLSAAMLHVCFLRHPTSVINVSHTV